MREYKFRGKRVDNGEWVYGNYFIDERDIEDGFIWRDIPQIQQRYGDHYQYYDVDPSTVGQYTGLKDKNGKEIYEGDIVEFSAPYYDNYQIRRGVVEFIVDMFCVLTDDWYFNFGEIDVIEAIGNIYEHPDLLKE